jgi:uncharacterized membrane protein
MQMGQLHYLPLTPSFFSILVGVFLILFFLLILGALRRAYLNLGVSSTTAMLLLLASLIGSYFNIPIAELSQELQLDIRGPFAFQRSARLPQIAEGTRDRPDRLRPIALFRMHSLSRPNEDPSTKCGVG